MRHPLSWQGQLTYHPFLKSVLAERRKIAAMSAAPEVQGPEAAQVDNFELKRPERREIHAWQTGNDTWRQAASEGAARAPGPARVRGGAGLTQNRPSQASKFASKIDNADIVLMVKNFARHELFHIGKEAMDRPRRTLYRAAVRVRGCGRWLIRSTATWGRTKSE